MIVGLGNPGSKYANTRHNIGFLVIEALARQASLGAPREREKALVWEGLIEGEKILLVEPQTYMNLSGEAVGALSRYYKIPPEEILVVYDDMDLAVGRLRFKGKGGAGGHNGIKSLLAHLAGEGFHRLKVGVGRPPQGWKPADYVLSPFAGEDRLLIEERLPQAVDACRMWIRAGLVEAMNRFNGEG